MLSRCEHQVEVVAAASASASKRGVRPGMTLAHARALLPTRHCIEALDEAGVAWSLRRAGVASTRLAPVVSLDPPDGLLCDVSGCERLYGSVARLVRLFGARFRRRGFAVRVAAAPTFGAAWALARFGAEPEAVVTQSDVLDALRDLPLAALRLEPATLDRLARIGFSRIGELLAISRDALAARYGDGLLLRLDQALGRTPELITPLRGRPPLIAEMTFDGPTDRLESITLAARNVITRVCELLHARERGCRLLELTLDRSDMAPLTLRARTSRPSRDPKHLWSLLASEVDRAELGFGVQGVAARAGQVSCVAHTQREHWAPAPAEAPADIANLADTLGARLGAERVRSLRAIESHVPEAAFAFDVGLPEAELAKVTSEDRPSVLFDPPRPIEVTLLVPDGPLAAIRMQGDTHPVVAGIGPERIEEEWWRPAALPRVRDYFKVALLDGRVLWIFRASVGERDAWFVHGEWA